MDRIRRLVLVILTLAAVLLVVTPAAHAAAPNVRIVVHALMEDQATGQPSCFSGTFRARGALTDEGTARMCDRRFENRHLFGVQNLAGSTGHYRLAYKVTCSFNGVTSVCEGTWRSDENGLVGSGTTRQVSRLQPDGSFDMEAEYVGTIR